MNTINTVLFDLDGTLVDTAPDMILALNRLCQLHGRDPIAFHEARPHVSNGSVALVKLGFGSSLNGEQHLMSLRQQFLDLYAQNVCVDSHLFPGMAAVLDYLNSRKLRWGIVTNKPGALTAPLVKALMLSTRAGCVVSGDTVAKAKPDPMPLFHACELMGIEPGNAVYVGDSSRDIDAGRRAGMETLSADYGYIVPGDDPASWQANGSIDSPLDLISWLDKRVA